MDSEDIKVESGPERVTDINHLKGEKSPYLLQHADNPVNWYPWGKEAFDKAKKEDRPIFLSIGYSTCHWCHVMARESFENQEIADIMNKYFVSIKVDREERPDIDGVYMKAVMSLTGSGGWPLTVFLTPDKKPFYGGTYFPPESMWGRPGLKELLLSINDAWSSKRSDILQSSQSIIQALEQSVSKYRADKSSLGEDIFKLAYLRFRQDFDPSYGGFGNAPKFPSGHNLSFLLRYWKRSGEAGALEIVTKTLAEMAKGGMYDHIGGGFHRYSTDKRWRIPHFEKMLYDQAILSKIFLEAYQVTGKSEYADVASQVFEYVMRDMTDIGGGFYSAEDADSLVPKEFSQMTPARGLPHEKSEGAFYLWRQEEIEEHLGKDNSRIFDYYFGVDPQGNADSDPHGEFKGKNILYIAHTVSEAAEHFNKSAQEVNNIIAQAKGKLLGVRIKRPRPHLDDKILTDWNGLMISGLAFGSRVLDKPLYRDAAEKAAQFILKNLIREDGRLLHRYREGDAAILGTLEDYAFFIHGLIDLYEATFKDEYLVEAKRLAEDMIKLFEDSEKGGFFFTASDAETVLLRDKEIYDGAIPSGNSVAALDLIRLWKITFDKTWQAKASRLFDAFSNDISTRPTGYAQALIALDFAIGPSKEIILAEGQDKEQIKRMIDSIYRSFVPNKVVILRPYIEEKADKILSISPFIEGQIAKEGKTTAYVCENHVCKIPTSDLEKLKDLLK